MKLRPHTWDRDRLPRGDPFQGGGGGEEEDDSRKSWELVKGKREGSCMPNLTLHASIGLKFILPLPLFFT